MAFKNSLIIGPINGQVITINATEADEYSCDIQAIDFGIEFNDLNDGNFNFFELNINNIVLVGAMGNSKNKKYGTVHEIKKELYTGKLGVAIKSQLKHSFKKWKKEIMELA